MFICDNHIHSNHSFDGQNSVEELCLAAIKKGVHTITVTDHCEVDGIADPDNSEYGNFCERIPASLADIKRCAEKYRGRLKVYSGVEIGQAIYAPQDIVRAVRSEDVDFVLASIHNLKNTPDFYYLQYNEENIPIYLEKYFCTVLELAKWNRFDSLAHLTYPLRYIYERTDFKFDPAPYQKVIDEIFITLIKNERALEINTSGLRKPISETLPAQREIHRYRQLGGVYITIGSDAHNTADLGEGIETAALLAKDCGFKNYYYYENHRPIAIDI